MPRQLPSIPLTAKVQIKHLSSRNLLHNCRHQLLEILLSDLSQTEVAEEETEE